MASGAVRDALNRRLQVLDRNLPAAVEPGDAEAVHRSRVASRRLREALPVIHSPSATPRLRKTRKAVRRLTRLLGGVRELDVSLAVLDALQREHPDLGDAIEFVRAFVQRERLERRAEMLRRLEDLNPRKLRKQLAALADEETSPAPLSERRDRLARRLRPRVTRVAEAMAAAGSLYAFDRLHLVRIAIKRLRYLLELAREVSRVGTARPVRQLKTAQELLGRLHDLEVLAGFVRAALPSQTGDAVHLRALLHLIERETRLRHAEYLRLVPALNAVLETCRTDLDRRLTHHV